MKIRGRDLVSGLPKEITVTDGQIREALSPSFKQIVESISDTIEQTPPELVADIYERGLVLSGGAALLRNFDKMIQKKLSIPIHMADDPSTSVVRGAGLILEDFENLKSVIIPSARE
jgi:rod shape-determining protein MreB